MTPFDISPIDDTDAVRIEVHGDVDYETSAAIHDALAPGGRFIHARRLWDLRGCKLRLTPEELKHFANMAAEYDHAPARVAVLIDGDLEFGMMRIHGAYRESEFTALHVCRDEAEALAWLFAEDEADGG